MRVIDEDITEPDDRESKLPGWARQRLHALRARLRYAEEEVSESRYAATATAGNLDADTAAVVIDVPGADSLGLPAGTEVTFRLPEGGMITVTLKDDGILLDAVGDLVLHPMNSAFQMLVRTQSTTQMTNGTATRGYGYQQRQSLQEKEPGRW